VALPRKAVAVVSLNGGLAQATTAVELGSEEVAEQRRLILFRHFFEIVLNARSMPVLPVRLEAITNTVDALQNAYG
jgi:hypothetical protein